MKDRLPWIGVLVVLAVGVYLLTSERLRDAGQTVRRLAIALIIVTALVVVSHFLRGFNWGEPPPACLGGPGSAVDASPYIPPDCARLGY